MSDDLGLLAELDLRRETDPLVPLPGTGEAIDLRDPQSVVGGVERLREFKRDANEVLALLTTVLRIEAMRQGTKTIRLGATEVVLAGGTKIVYDAEALIEDFRSAGMPEERISEIVVQEISYKVNAARAKAAASANPAYADAIERNSTVVPAPWYASVKR